MSNRKSDDFRLSSAKYLGFLHALVLAGYASNMDDCMEMANRVLTETEKFVREAQGIREEQALQNLEKRVDQFAALLDAIQEVESGGQANPPDGDNGKSIGPFQIQLSYYLDAIVNLELEQSIRPPFGFSSWLDEGLEPEALCRNPEYARIIVASYMRRYAPNAIENGEWEKMARIHNGGPSGHKKQSTLEYWHKVLKIFSNNG